MSSKRDRSEEEEESSSPSVSPKKAKKEPKKRLKLPLSQKAISEAYTYEEFKADPSVPGDIKRHLDRDGVAIVPSVLTQQECEEAVAGMWAFLAHVTSDWEVPIAKDNKASWKQFSRLSPKHSMLVQEWQVGHAQFIWNIRANPKILKIAKELCQAMEPEAAKHDGRKPKQDIKETDLICSFDGAAFHLPTDHLPKKEQTGFFKNPWFHTDQRLSYSGLDCYQIQVPCEEVPENAATLCVMTKSHLHHGEFARKYRSKELAEKQKLEQEAKAKGGKKKAKKMPIDNNWYKLETQEEMDFFLVEKKCEIRFIKCPKGSVVIWDSRTMHFGAEPQRGREEVVLRCTVYVSYSLRDRAEEKVIERRIKYLKDMRMTSHWAHDPALFGLKPRDYGGKNKDNPVICKPIPPPELTPIMRRLVGFEK